MLTIHVNSGGRSPVPDVLLQAAVRRALLAEGVADGEVSLTLLDDPEILEMNRTYLGQDRPTDVIAFALHGPGEAVLGDVYLGIEQAARQASELGVDLGEELVRLSIHGTLHVLGYEHPEGDDREGSPFFERQERLLRELMAESRPHTEAEA